jgi:Domain of unknown function (DUF932)
MIHTITEVFAKENARLCSTPVTEGTWTRFLDEYVPRVGDHGHQLTGKALTLAEQKRTSLDQLYRTDERVTPWSGTAHGVLQAVNTYEHHLKPVRGTTRTDRNMLRTITGDFADLDVRTEHVLARVLI